MNSCNFETTVGDSVDHILPVSFGFNWRIPPDLMSDKRNLRIISLRENISKSYKCDHIPQYIQRYMIDTHYRLTRERQKEGIRRARTMGVYMGRKKGTVDSVEKFLNKPKNKAAIELLRLGWKAVDIAKEIDIHINTITKIKKLIATR
jgi:DNA invertase Pin-like site-specific DNA recombinase